jgi:nitrogen fixation-related uncharacterized protein
MKPEVPACKSLPSIKIFWYLAFLFVVSVFFTPILADAQTQLCNQYDNVEVSNGSYRVQTNRFGPPATECLSVDTAGTDFSVISSTINTGTNSPGAYPSIYRGCHWGTCTPGSGAPLPIQVSNLATATSGWATVGPNNSSDLYDKAYDIWFNTTPTTSTQPDGAELMIWLNWNGVQPAGSIVSTSAQIAGATWEVWTSPANASHNWNIISYRLAPGSTNPSINQTAATNLDINSFITDAVNRSLVNPSWYLIAVEAGTEIWKGGVGLGTSSFAFSASTGTPPTPAPPPSSASESIWWPTDGSVLSGTQPFKARLDNVALSSYNMYWSVDNGQLNLMSDNSSGGDHKEASVDLSGWTWRDAGTNWGPFSVNFIAKDGSGNILQQKAVTIYVAKSLSNTTESIWWPTDGSVLSGTQPFKARLDNVALTAYNMYWSVDNGQPNVMSNNSNGGDHKEASVDLSGWTWRDAGTNWGPFSVNFIAKDLSGNLIQQKAVNIYVVKTGSLSTATLSIWWPTDGSVLSGVQPFKALLNGIALSSYQMYWSVDNGQFNLMTDNTVGGDHKEASVDLSGWTWRDNGTNYGPFSVTFTAQDLSGNPVKTQTITIYRSK